MSDANDGYAPNLYTMEKSADHTCILSAYTGKIRVLSADSLSVRLSAYHHKLKSLTFFWQEAEGAGKKLETPHGGGAVAALKLNREGT